MAAAATKTTLNISMEENQYFLQTANSIKTVMANKNYLVLTLTVSTAVFLFSIWLPNFSFVGEIITSEYFTVNEKVSILFSSLGAFQTNFGPFGRVALVAISLLFGLNIGLFTFYLKRGVALQRAAGMSMAGILAGLIGIGCASCGSFILASIFGMSAAAAFIGLLPFRGQEFAVAGIIILSLSIILIARKIQEPLVCK